MKKVKIDFARIKIFFQKVPGALSRKAFLFLIVALLVDLSIGALIYYRYTYLIKFKETEFKRPPGLKEALLESIKQGLKEREDRFREIDSKNYSNLFGQK